MCSAFSTIIIITTIIILATHFAGVQDLARLDKELASVKEGVQQASRAVADLNARHPWIAAEKQFFGEAHSDFDFKWVLLVWRRRPGSDGMHAQR